MNLRYYKELDGIRTIAAFMVMFFHYFMIHPLGGNLLLNSIQDLVPFGQGGVTLFFVLSGFLITRILINSKEETSYFKNFYIRRVLRIFPLYFLFLGIYYITFGILNNTDIPEFRQQIWYWLYVQNISDTFHLGAIGPDHFWSLAIEEQFYIFWPLFIFIVPKKHLKYLVFAVIIGANVLRIIMVLNSKEVFYFTLTRMDELALGALIAVGEFEVWDIRKRNRQFLLLTAFFLLSMVGLKILIPDYGNPLVQILKYPLMSFFSFFLILYTISLESDEGFKRFLNLRIMRHLGKISYGLYVYHPICFLLVTRFLSIELSPVNFILCFVLTIGISHISYVYFEERFLRLKPRFT